ncbi:hypothetical protein CROQUDRAFT_133686 [Cronartium quercuum f. sp. fusiforme G11]|uniref:Uncharacterized protein n=1 Tax=Cronartium quercuum f. sp. fusiforme G11 TaxID=708437 RepID=A0A9P6TAV4_9BASI|nr:hypothetical protein CROQUDRAFT_133686 [Cronartium quercuum f. sp. fusiforme G11]
MSYATSRKGRDTSMEQAISRTTEIPSSDRSQIAHSALWASITPESSNEIQEIERAQPAEVITTSDTLESGGRLLLKGTPVRDVPTEGSSHMLHGKFSFKRIIAKWRARPKKPFRIHSVRKFFKIWKVKALPKRDCGRSQPQSIIGSRRGPPMIQNIINNDFEFTPSQKDFLSTPKFVQVEGKFEILRTLSAWAKHLSSVDKEEVSKIRTVVQEFCGNRIRSQLQELLADNYIKISDLKNEEEVEERLEKLVNLRNDLQAHLDSISSNESALAEAKDKIIEAFGGLDRTENGLLRIKNWPASFSHPLLEPYPRLTLISRLFGPAGLLGQYFQAYTPGLRTFSEFSASLKLTSKQSSDLLVLQYHIKNTILRYTSPRVTQQDREIVVLAARKKFQELQEPSVDHRSSRVAAVHSELSKILGVLSGNFLWEFGTNKPTPPSTYDILKNIHTSASLVLRGIQLLPKNAVEHLLPRNEGKSLEKGKEQGEPEILKDEEKSFDEGKKGGEIELPKNEGKYLDKGKEKVEPEILTIEEKSFDEGKQSDKPETSKNVENEEDPDEESAENSLVQYARESIKSEFQRGVNTLQDGFSKNKHIIKKDGFVQITNTLEKYDSLRSFIARFDPSKLEQSAVKLKSDMPSIESKGKSGFLRDINLDEIESLEKRFERNLNIIMEVITQELETLSPENEQAHKAAMNKLFKSWEDSIPNQISPPGSQETDLGLRYIKKWIELQAGLYPKESMESRMEVLFEVFGPMDRYHNIPPSTWQSILQDQEQGYTILSEAVKKFRQVTLEKLMIISEVEKAIDRIQGDWSQEILDWFIESLTEQKIPTA